MAIPWYYMWSDNYRIFHEIMKDSMKDPDIILCPIEVPQERFDSELYSKEGSHFWRGSCIKLNYIIEYLKKAKEESTPYILFTDIDIHVRTNIYSDLKYYMDNNFDMVFMKEGAGINFGFVFLRVCDDIIQFFNKVIYYLKYINTNLMDQECVNQLLPSYTGKYGCFNEHDFIVSTAFNIGSPTSYKVIQCLCSSGNKEYNIFEKTISFCLIIDIRPYMKYSSLSIDLIHHINRILVKKYNMPPELLYEPPV